jgi:hypothetical protein
MEHKSKRLAMMGCLLGEEADTLGEWNEAE